MTAGCAAAGLAVLLAACGPAIGGTSGSSSSAPASSDGGTTATYAMAPGGQAQYPFPFIESLAFDSVYNINDYQYMLYRPLYWFGSGVNAYLNPKLSLADKPEYKGHEVTIRLKQNYKWSDGEPVDAADVVFWMNMMANQGINSVYWSQTGLPGDVNDVRAASKYVVTMHITTPSFSETWFTNNELSEITPMPLSWDRTASGKSNCHTDAASCAAVFTYLNAQSVRNPSTFPDSPLWSVVDGPWKLQSMSPSGKVILDFNTKYSGPVAPGHITKFIELPFASEASEFDVLQDPTGSQTIDVGYLPTVDAQSPPAGSNVGPNARTLSGYRLLSVYPWEISYFPYNFNNQTGHAPIFDQLYFRQAFQHLVDQEGVINGPLHGYGKATTGPVSPYPLSQYLSSQVAANGDAWTLNIQGAKQTLEAHGWHVVPNGTDTCSHPGTGPGECGAHIQLGTKLQFTLQYATGIDWMESAARELESNASLAGIGLTLEPKPFNKVVSNAFFCFANPHKPCTWDMAFWGSWTYAPDYLPTGDTLFASTAPNNAGGYSNPQNDQLIKDTLTARTQSKFLHAMYNWENYLAGQLPVVYEPNTPQLMEVINGLNIGEQNSALSLTPENWRYLK
jgi:peptide/nickel transport system substrate-binding protein